MKWLVLVAFAAIAAWVLLAPTFGYDVGLQNVVELLIQAIDEVVNFFAKFLEGLG